MSRAAWPLVELAARLLEREEREAVLGDLAEAGENAWQALLDILRLECRRQALLWRSWRPWFAGFGIAFPSSLLLMGGFRLRDLYLSTAQLAQDFRRVRTDWAGRFLANAVSHLPVDRLVLDQRFCRWIGVAADALGERCVVFVPLSFFFG